MASIYSTTRITGLSSGLDTDSLIKAAMTASQAKLDRMYQSKTSLEWKRDAYTDVRKTASDFSSKWFSSLSSSNVFSKSVYKQFKVSMSDKYNSFFTVKGTSSAQAGNHTITSTKLATAAKLTSSPRTAGKGTVSINGASDVNKTAQVTTKDTWYVKTDSGFKKLSALSEAERKDVDLENIYTSEYEDPNKRVFKFSGEAGNEKAVLKVRSSNAKGTTPEDITLNKGAKFSEYLNALEGASVSASVNENGTLTYTSSVSGSDSTVGIDGQNAQFGDVELKQTIDGSTTLSSLMNRPGVKGEDGNITFSINGVTFSTNKNLKGATYIDPDLSLNEINETISKSEAGVKISLDDGGFHIVGNEAGPITIENISGKFFGAPGTAEDMESITGLRAQTATESETLDRGKDTIASAISKMGLKSSDVLKNGKLYLNIMDKNGKMQELSFDSSMTLDKMMSQINADTSLGVKVSYSQITDSFEFSSTETGHNAKIEIANSSDNGGDALAFFGIDKSSASAVGTDAEIVIDGKTIHRENNKFTLDGMEITIKDDWVADKTQYEGSTLGAAKLTVEQDIDSTVNLMKEFVEAYNSMVDSLYGMISEQKDYDYEPLTEDQRDNMEDKDIEKWETEAKKGVLYRDTTINSYLSKMRQAMFEKLDGTKFSDISSGTKDKGLSAADIGFTTTKYAYGEYGGKIEFDEAKFREALERDPDAVANIMANISDSSDKTTEYKESGFITKLFDITSDFVNTLRGTNIANVNKQISDYNDKMDDMIQKMYDEQERLYQQYASLETLMTQYQNQSSYISNMLGSLSAS